MSLHVIDCPLPPVKVRFPDIGKGIYQGIEGPLKNVMIYSEGSGCYRGNIKDFPPNPNGTICYTHDSIIRLFTNPLQLCQFRWFGNEAFDTLWAPVGAKLTLELYPER